MSIVVKHCDALLAKHHRHVSPLVLAAAFIVTFGFVSPTILYAAEVTSTSVLFAPMPEEFRPERARYTFNSSSPGPMLASSTERFGERDDKKDRIMTSTTAARIIQYRTVRIQRLKDALATIEKQAKDLRTELEDLQYASPSSTEALDLKDFNAKIGALLLVFKKTNFNLELTKLKVELKNEFVKRETEMKKEMLKKQAEQKREQLKQQNEQARERIKNEQELMKEQRKAGLPPPPSPAGTSPAGPSPSGTPSQ